MDLEDKISKIVKDAYDSTGFEDEGRADGVAHDIIALLREPTEAMCEAADSKFDFGPYGHEDRPNPYKVWQAMIDAALRSAK